MTRINCSLFPVFNHLTDKQVGNWQIVYHQNKHIHFMHIFLMLVEKRPSSKEVIVLNVPKYDTQPHGFHTFSLSPSEIQPDNLHRHVRNVSSFLSTVQED